MEATNHRAPSPRWFLITGALAIVFWFAGFLWFRYFRSPVSGPGIGFLLYFVTVVGTFIRRSYLLPLPSSSSLRHTFALGVALLLLAFWYVVGVFLLNQFPP